MSEPPSRPAATWTRTCCRSCVADRSIYDVLRLLADGASEAEILEDYPELEAEDIRACLAFAAEREQHTAVVESPP